MKINKRAKILLENLESIYCVHYSCENFNDSNEGYSPRITSIAILHMASNQMISFSMHLIAEEMHIPRDNIKEQYNEIEKKMLTRFFDFAKDKGDSAIWLHWNMSNINFGFETLEHRYRVLMDCEPHHINEKMRYNLSTLIAEKFGSKYAKDPKMQNLMEMNGGRHRSFLTGIEEVTAFRAGEYIKMHNSTMCKVYFFESSLRKMFENRLRTETNQLRYKISQLYQNPIVQILGIIGVAGTIISLVAMFFQGGA